MNLVNLLDLKNRADPVSLESLLDLKSLVSHLGQELNRLSHRIVLNQSRCHPVQNPVLGIRRETEGEIR